MITPPTFILIGAAGYVAPRHMAAIKAVGGELVAAVDQRDSVGILDHYAPKCAFYKNWYDVEERADYVVICTPNNTHAVAAYWALDSGMDVILEKPACIRMKRLRELQEVEKSTGKKVNCILQMRLHPSMGQLARLAREYDHPTVDILYHTPRGPWYAKSWKSDNGKSGGILFNIGIHLFDLALYVFGLPLNDDKSVWKDFAVTVKDDQALGTLRLKWAEVFFNLSTNVDGRARTFTVDGKRVDFTSGFENLHKESYSRILVGDGFTLEDAAPAIELCERMANA